MQAVVLTQLSTAELGQIIYEQVERFFSQQPVQTPKDRIGGVELAVEITGLKISTIYSKVSAREIPFSKPDGGKQLFFRESELLKWIADGRKRTQKEIAADAGNRTA